MLAKLLQLDALSDTRFITHNHQQNFRNSVFGGQVLAQALMAAGRTVEQRPPNSLHAYFLRAGVADVPIEYQVCVLRDGRSVSARSVNALQDDRLLFSMQASFHQPETGFFHQQHVPQHNVDPETLRQRGNLQQDLHLVQRASEVMGSTPVELVPYGHEIFEQAPSAEQDVRFWARSAGPLSAQPLEHFCALAFASDIGLLAAALLPHNTSLFAGEVFPASMDHSLWFHKPPKFDHWHQYITNSPWAGDGRALCQGSFYDTDNVLVASVSQEGLVRHISKQ